MTQVQAMTNQQLNMELALLMGYTKDKRYPGRVTRGNTVTMPNDYCNYPAASLEVEKRAIEVDYKAYLKNMQMLRWNRSSSRLSLWDAANLMLASPRERAEAAYITLQGADTPVPKEGDNQ